MKKILALFIVTGLISSIHARNDVRVLSKKDKQDLVDIFSDPCHRMDHLIKQLNEVAQQIQNFIIDVNVQEDSNNKPSLHHIVKHLELIEVILQQVAQEVIEQRMVLGNLDDQSVGKEDFNSVCDIDNAQLSFISLLKSIFRAQISDTFAS